MKLVVMTKSTFFVEEDKILAALFEAGMDNLHLYKPDSAPVYIERLLSLLPKGLYAKTTVHEHFYLKNEYALNGIHIDNPAAGMPVGYKGRWGVTCTDITQLKQMKKQADYVFLKNIFDCIEFKEQHSNFTIQQLEEAAARGLIDKHVYAMGGMTLDNVRIARELGFGGVVVCGDLWNRFDIHNQNDYKELVAHFEKLRKAVG
jgi:thiamine-phosphate pyrophosphorylase